MATTKIWPIYGRIEECVHYVENEEKTVSRETPMISFTVEQGEEKKVLQNPAILDVFSYVTKKEKTEEQKYVTTLNCAPDTAIKEMYLTKKQYGKLDKIVMHHAIQSFKPGEVTPEIAHQIGVKLAEELWGDRFQVVVATHLDRAHIHNHFAINSVSFVDGKKFYDNTAFYTRMRQTSDRLCREYDLSVIETAENSGHRHRGVLRAEEEGRYTLEKIVKEDVDACILYSKNLGDFFRLMQSKGYRIDTQRKYLRIYPYGHTRPIRIDRRWQEEYTLEGIRKRIEEQGGRSIKQRRTTWTRQRVVAPVYRFSGLQAGYVRYLYLMGVLPKKSPRQIARTHYLLREDLMQLDTYIAESQLLISRNIRTKMQLDDVRRDEIAILESMNKDRNQLRNRIRRCKTEDKVMLQEELKDINQMLRKQKKTVYYCNHIKRSMEDMQRKTEQLSEIRRNEKGEESSYEWSK